MTRPTTRKKSIFNRSFLLPFAFMATRKDEIERWHQLLTLRGLQHTVDKINIDITGHERKVTAQFAKSGHYFFLYGITKNDSAAWSGFPNLKYADEFKDGVLLEAKKQMTDEEVIAFLKHFINGAGLRRSYRDDLS